MSEHATLGPDHYHLLVSRPLNLFRCWTNPWWSSSFRLVISPVISGRTIRDLHAHSKKSARRRWTHSRMSSRRWWWKTVSGQSSRSRICWRWGLNWGEKKECAQLPTVSEFWHVLDNIFQILFTSCGCIVVSAVPGYMEWEGEAHDSPAWLTMTHQR